MNEGMSSAVVFLVSPEVSAAWTIGFVLELRHRKASWEPMALVQQRALGEPLFKLVKHPESS